MAEFITDVFLVTARDSDISTFILETTTKNNDANLWESSWRHKGKRYIGFKRNYEDDYVVTDITVINEDKDVPDDYAGLLITKDTKEKGVKKHIICYKRESRKVAKQAITEINVICESKGEMVPAQFTAMNQSVNDLLLVFKLDDIPVQQEPLKPAPRTSPAVQVVQNVQNSPSSPGSPSSGIEGIPFQINPKYNTKSAQNDPVIGGIYEISIDELAQKYSYTFIAERRVTNNR